VLVTGSGTGEGKSTAALNLAHALAIASKRVILIEADVHNPGIGSALGIRPERGVASVLVDGVPLSEALVGSEAHGGNLQLLLADRGGQWMADHLSLPSALAMIEQAKLIADYVIVDSPPVGPVGDALPLARVADDVLLVVRLGTTDVHDLATSAELLAQQGVEPVGFVVMESGDERGYRRRRNGGRNHAAQQREHESEPERAPAVPTS
jgi:Mrp family chromosome partitioning ATPase